MAARDFFDRPADGPDAAEIFNRFTRRLIALARSRLDARVRAKVDPEDVVQSVYRSFFTRQAAGACRVDDWDELWALLTIITVRKCANRNHFFRADRRDVSREAGTADAMWDVPGRDPTPEEGQLLAETVEGLMSGLEGRDRDILALSLQGYTAEEIGDRLGRALRTVRRVRERVRKRLERMLTGAA